MKITTLGSGSAFSIHSYNTSFLISTDDNKNHLLFDCGSDFKYQLNMLKHHNINLNDITDVYISHVHGDHFSGLEFLSYSKFFTPNTTPFTVHCHKDVKAPLADALQYICNISQPVDGLSSFFSFNNLTDSDIITIGEGDNRLEFELVKADHITRDDKNSRYDMPCYGLYERRHKVLFTSDITFKGVIDNLSAYYKEASVIFQDCEVLYSKDGDIIKSGVHAHYSELNTLPSDIKRKMYLVHRNSNTNSENIHIPTLFTMINNGFLNPPEEGSIYNIPLN